MTGRKRAVILSVVAAVLLVAVLAGLLVAGSLWGIPPFGGLMEKRLSRLAGNGEEYAAEHVLPLDGSPLKGKRIAFLGSSVTYGASSLGTSFVEYLAARNDFIYRKEAVSGTTLVDNGENSYIARMKRMDRAEEFDLFVVQLSTNDATKHVPLGEIAGKDAENYDTSTVCGAIEYIIGYVRKAWNCPVVFYTNAYYESENYAAMVGALKQIAAEYGIGVIDLYTDEAFNAITDEQRSLYMADSIHPTKAGYLLWWTPEMEEYLYAFVR